MTRDEITGYRVEITMTGEPRDSVEEKVDWTGRSVEYEARGDGKEKTITSSVSKLEESEMGANKDKRTQDWDSPAEGIEPEAGEEAGEQYVD